MNGFERRRAQKKKDILEAALVLFMEYGVQKPSIAEIAQKAGVSQVTIYNYFESKHNLAHEVFLYYLDKMSEEFKEILLSELDFPEKVKRLIFRKKEAAQEMHEDLYLYIMREYTTSPGHLREIFQEKTLPNLFSLFNQGKEQGYVDPNLSNEAILFFMHALYEYLQREEVYSNVLPMTEDIMKLIFYGIAGKRE
ncbi:TetR family transcriptional regulator [Xylanibacillus composti]|uniref:TetR family transcriptional regulator n=1 Tax=Xylanibacillus composti TaxID=1572762 RepID=A0A8J4H3K8_9BACL|nr:TetR/AcrR family transcriptional regulator [Xylanibacillus composti]GIQ68847.1 TetR family transcriptional regulator [Xylanibacillus composti]